MKKSKQILLLLFITACAACGDSADSLPVTENKKDTTIVKSEVINEECIFDEITQTSEFLDTIPAFKNNIWIDSLKRATIPLNNNDTLLVHRGGCVHFNYYITLICHSDNHSFDDKEYWLKKVQSYTRQLSDFDNEMIDSLWTNKLIEEDINDDQIYISFNQELYCHQSFRIEKNKDGSVSIELGYYQC